MKSKMLWVLIIISCVAIVTVFSMAGCKEETASAEEEVAPAEEEAEEPVVEEKESYHFILVNNFSTWSHFYPDYIGAAKACEEISAWTGDEVTFEVVGPSENDVMGEVEAMETAIVKKPDGFMVVVWDEAMFTAPINKAMDAGIPVVTVDADAPNSNRLCYVGTSWEQLGVELANALVENMGEAGKIAMLGVVGANNMETAFATFKDVIANYPDIEIVALENDDGVPEEATRITSALIQAYPDLKGVAGFDAGSGPGIVTAVREAGKGGEIIIVGNDMNVPQLQALEEGIEHFIIGQKREFFGYWGVQMLYSHIKTQLKFTEDDVAAGNIVNIPPRVVTGFHYATPENFQYFLDAFAEYEAMEFQW